MISITRVAAAALSSAVLVTAGGTALAGAATAGDNAHHHNFHANKVYVDGVRGHKLLVAFGRDDRRQTVLLDAAVKVDGKESSVAQLHHGDIVNLQGYVADDDMAVVEHVVVTHRSGEKAGDEGKGKGHGKKHGKHKAKGHGKKHGKGKAKGHRR